MSNLNSLDLLGLNPISCNSIWNCEILIFKTCGCLAFIKIQQVFILNRFFDGGQKEYSIYTADRKEYKVPSLNKPGNSFS